MEGRPRAAALHVLEEITQLSLLDEAGAWITLVDSMGGGLADPDPSYWDKLLDGATACRFEADANWIIYRARYMPLDKDSSAEPLPCDDMGAPPAHKTPSGRMNRKGVPRFYGALEPDTAIAETRPWRKARISLGEFLTVRPLSLVDLSGDYVMMKPARSLQWLSFMLARPVHRDDEHTYLPSQRFADDCEAAGFDGILFDSSLGHDGVNVVLFDPTTIRCTRRAYYEITDVTYSKVAFQPFA